MDILNEEFDKVKGSKKMKNLLYRVITEAFPLTSIDKRDLSKKLDGIAPWDYRYITQLAYIYFYFKNKYVGLTPIEERYVMYYFIEGDGYYISNIEEYEDYIKLNSESFEGDIFEPTSDGKFYTISESYKNKRDVIKELLASKPNLPKVLPLEDSYKELLNYGREDSPLHIWGIDDVSFPEDIKDDINEAVDEIYKNIDSKLLNYYYDLYKQGKSFKVSGLPKDEREAILVESSIKGNEGWYVIFDFGDDILFLLAHYSKLYDVLCATNSGRLLLKVYIKGVMASSKYWMQANPQKLYNSLKTFYSKFDSKEEDAKSYFLTNFREWWD